MIEAAARCLIRILPEKPALSLLCSLAGRIRPLPVSSSQQAAMGEASRLRYGADGRQVAWSWGKGPVVMLVHGWGGRAAQMAPLAVSLARQGFRAVAPDITGHGDSPDRRSSWGHFLGDIAALSAVLGGRAHACIGHSAGGLAMMAARAQHGFGAERYIAVCAPSFPYPPIVAVKKRLDPPAGILERYKGHIAAQFGGPWAALESGAAFAGAGANLLVIHDASDRYLDGGDAGRIAALCPDAQFVELKGYGHQKILGSAALAELAIGFLGR